MLPYQASARRARRIGLIGTLSLGLALTGLAPAPASTASTATAARRVSPPVTATAAVPVADTVSTAARRIKWKPRRARYNGTTTRKDLAIKMSDGVILRGDLTRPTKNGKAVKGKLPVIITITAYNKTVLGSSPLGGSGGDYLVKRGYQSLVVDARGTGSSAGVWKAFSPRENKDAAEIVTWAAKQKWSNGRSGMIGPSYMGISQIFAASGRPKGLKAIFPQVPAADVYRDVVASGGQIDVGFIPLWLGLVTATGVIPPAYGASEPANGLGWALDHLTGAGSFTGPLMLKALLGQRPAYDGKFYRHRSPIEVIDKVKVPTFLIGGEYDLFQRGTPLLFERLRKNGVPTRMIIGPWDHLQGSSGAQVARAGYGTLEELQLRWFDKWVKGKKDARLMKDIAPMTYYQLGSKRWVRTKQYVNRDLKPQVFKLSGSAIPTFKTARLTRGRARAGTAIVPPIPTAGLCTRSSSQWTAGITNLVPVTNPCLENNQLNDQQTVVFETAPLKKRLRIQGPMNARLYVSSPTGDGMLSVTVQYRNAKTSKYVTGGWQVISHRALNKKKSRYVKGKLVQAYHPFTKSAKKRARPNKVVPVDVEIFPTGMVVKKGARLRISIAAFDTPHLLAPITDLPGQLAPMTIHTGKRYPSALTVLTR